MAVYEEMAEFYDMIYGDVHDADFYLLEAKNAKGPVLEVGCGTGRILLRLLAKGIDITGLDISEAMLGVLKRNAAAMGLKSNIVQGDMRDFRLNRRFKLIIVPYRGFLHMLTEADQKKALACFLEHLEPGGRLILHTYELSKDELACTGGFHLTDSYGGKTPEGKRYELEWYLDYDRRTSVGRYRIILTMDSTERTFEMDVAVVRVQDVKRLLGSCGYRNVKVYCGFDYAPHDSNCREVLVFAEK